MYVLLHGAKKNVGDFLIFERARELIKTYRNSDDFLELPRWESLRNQLDIINQAEAVIWCGGPGYTSDFYPNILPLVDKLSTIKVPIVPMGLGWGVGERCKDVQTFSFSKESVEALQFIHAQIPYSSVRDVLTEQVVNNADIRNVVTTGCAAWYYLPKVADDFVPPANIRRIIVTTPANMSLFQETGRVMKLISELFPKAERYLVFHRGIWPDQYTSVRTLPPNLYLSSVGYRYGFKIIDASYSTDKIEFYKDCDLHIGYRVHAHINFLSLRKPSILFQEDARGEGQSQTLGTADILAGAPNSISQLQEVLGEYLDSRFESFHKTIQFMKEKHHTMKDFVQSF